MVVNQLKLFFSFLFINISVCSTSTDILRFLDDSNADKEDNQSKDHRGKGIELIEYVKAVPIPGAAKASSFLERLFQGKALGATLPSISFKDESAYVTKEKCINSPLLYISGRCLSTEYKKLAAFFHPKLSKLLSLYFTITKTKTLNINSCVGDFKGGDFGVEKGLQATLCSNIPVNKEENFSVMSFLFDNLNCSSGNKLAKFCSVYDSCGTYAFQLNKEILNCMVNILSTKEGTLASNESSLSIQKTLNTLSSMLLKISNAGDEFGFGFSPKRKFQTSLQVPTFEEEKIKLRTVKVKGHFYLNFTLKIPYNYIIYDSSKTKRDNINGLTSVVKNSTDILKSLDIELGAQSSILLDYGGDWESLKKFSSELDNDRENFFKKLIPDVINSSGELVATIKGTILFKLQKLTFGFIPDIDMTVGQSQMLLVRSSLNGEISSGLEKGLYFKVGQDVTLNKSLKTFLSNFDGLFKFFGIKYDKIGIPDFGIEFSIVINSSTVGLSFKFADFDLTCIYTNDKEEGRSFHLSINGISIKGLIEQGKVVFKRVKDFITNEVIAIKEYSIDVWEGTVSKTSDFSRKTFKAAKKLFKDTYSLFFD